MLSVVVPTHNRSESAVRLAEALDRQECRSPVEVTFVLDGCRDNTRQALESLDLRRPLNIIELCGAGAAAARNRGAKESMGETLLFIDDDVMPAPGLLEAHLRAQGSRERLVVVGPYPYGPEMPVNPLDFLVRDWWQKRFAEMANPDHTFTHEDCVTGNISMPRGDFESIGGFDECFEKDGREDYELGARLLKSGMTMAFAPDALAYHYPTNRPRSSLRKWFIFGRADVKFAVKHPDLFHSLPIARWRHISPACCGMSRLLLPLCVRPQHAVGFLGAFFERNLNRMWQPRYRRLWECSRNFTYFLGAINECGGVRRFEEFVGRWVQPDERARRSIAVVDVFPLAGPQTIKPSEQTDRLFLLPRVGQSIAAWTEHSAEDEVRPDQLARHLSQTSAWQIWRQAVGAEWNPVKAVWDVIPDCRDRDAERRAGKDRTVSIVVLSSKDDSLTDELLEASEDQPIVRVASCEGRMVSGLKRALRECSSDLVAFLKPDDRPDPGWRGAVVSDFGKPEVGCVLTPAILRAACSRADELYHELAGFSRVRSWENTCLSDWMQPADILSAFPAGCHRLVFRKQVLSAALETLPGRSPSPGELMTRLLVGMIYLYQSIGYDPRALVWCSPPESVRSVAALGTGHSRMVRRAVAERLCLHGPGKVRTLRMMTGLLRADMPALHDPAGTHGVWPLKQTLAGVTAGFQGFRQGIAARDHEETEVEVSVRKDKGVIWVC